MTWTFKHLAGGGLLLAAAVVTADYWAAVAQAQEAAGCANDTCKNIDTHYICDLKTGIKEELGNCNPCKAADGRCKDGKNVACNPLTMRSAMTSLKVTLVCFCGQGATKSNTVEAQVTYNGPYGTAGFRGYCQTPPSGGK